MRIPLQESIDAYIALLEKSGKTNTAAAYRSDLGQFCQYMMQQEKDDWSQINAEQIIAYLREQQERYAYCGATTARKFGAIKSLFRSLKDQELIKENPLEMVALLPYQKKRTQETLTQEQVQLLLAQMNETPAGIRDRALLCLLLNASEMHISEIVALDLRQVDLQASELSRTCDLRQPVMVLSSRAREAIRCYLDQSRPHLIREGGERALFLNRCGKRLSRQGFWLIIKSYARRAGISPITLCMVRKTGMVAQRKPLDGG